MGNLNTWPVEQEINAWFDSTFPQFQIYHGAVTNPGDVVYVNDQIEPYLAIRYSDPTRSPIGNSMAGARYDTYYMFMDVYAVAQSSDVVRNMVGNILDTVIGHTFSQTSQIAKTAGGGQFQLYSAAERPPAHVSVVGFRFNLNFIGQS